MIVLEPQGRLGNILLQNVGISLLAKKFNYRVHSYQRIDESNQIGLNLFSGERVNQNLALYTDENLMQLMNLDTDLPHGIYYRGFFQEIEFLKKYKEDIKNLVVPQNVTKHDDSDVFIHIRLDDAEFASPGIAYYEKALSELNYKTIYVSSDSPYSNLVQTLISKYNMNLYQNYPVETINFAKNFNNLILSNGTFSWWMAFLSNATNIFYPELKNIGRIFHPDIYYPEWKCIKV